MLPILSIKASYRAWRDRAATSRDSHRLSFRWAANGSRRSKRSLLRSHGLSSSSTHRRHRISPLSCDRSSPLRLRSRKRLVLAPVHDAADIERAIGVAKNETNAGLVVVPSAFATIHRDLIIGLAARHRLPSVYGFSYYAASG